MSRNENDDVQHLVIPDSSTKVLYVFASGIMRPKEECDECAEKICAKVVSITLNESDIYSISEDVSYYILCNNYNRMFNPRETDPTYKRKAWKYRKVDRTTFELYVKFLKQKYNSLLTQAERRL